MSHRSEAVLARNVALKGGHGSALFGIWLSGANCLVALPALLVSDHYSTVRLLASVSLVLFGVLLFRHLDNILFLGRTLFLGLVGYYPIAVKVFAGEDALFSLYEPSTQGLDISIVMYVGTSLALLGSEVGLAVGSGQRRRPRAAAADPELWRTIFYMSVPLVVVVSTIVIRTTPSVLTFVYGSTGIDGYILGNLHAIAIICLLSMFVAMYKIHVKYGWIIFALLAVVFLAWALFLRGFRQDVVTTLFGLVICYGLVHGRPHRLSFATVGVVCVVCVVVEFMGTARGMIATSGTTIGEISTEFTSTLFKVGETYHFGTVSPDATTFANTVHLIKSGTMDPLWGWSYWEFIPRTPPAFMFPDRPRDYAWMFPDYGLGAGGGIFELAEAYMNFGLLGTLVVPGLISFLMARAFVNAKQSQTVAAYFLLFSFLGIFLRGAMYQTFAYYKCFWTAVILLLCFSIAHAYLGRKQSSPRRAATNWSAVRELG